MARGVKRVHCVLCGRHVDVCGPLSRRFRCGDCWPAAVIDNAVELHRHEGDGYERWKAAMRRVAQRLA